MIDPITLKVVSMALDAVTMRQNATAANIANASNPDYAPQRVSFEDRLSHARKSLSETGHVDTSALVAPELRNQTDQRGQTVHSVHIDSEVATLGQNTVKYEALVKGLSQSFNTISIALGEAK